MGEQQARFRSVTPASIGDPRAINLDAGLRGFLRDGPVEPVRRRRFFTGCDRDGEVAASNRNSTAEETLFTFCPPGPEARIKLSVSSQS